MCVHAYIYFCTHAHTHTLTHTCMFCYNVFTYAVDQNPYGEAQVLLVLQAENEGL